MRRNDAFITPIVRSMIGRLPRFDGTLGRVPLAHTSRFAVALQRGGDNASADFIASRAAASLAAGALLGGARCRFRVAHGDGGAPFLVDQVRGPIPVSLSLSHSRGWGAAAVSSRDRVGIDLEFERPELGKVAPAFLDQQESSRLERRGCVACRTTWLLLFWTAKEAVLKALGTGLRICPRRVTVQAGIACLCRPAWLSGLISLGPGERAMGRLEAVVESGWGLSVAALPGSLPHGEDAARTFGIGRVASVTLGSGLTYP
jgi:4'-phosphopantetheinyl transferase EntD